MSGKKRYDSETLRNCDNLYRLAERLGVPERKVMDFSAPVNPLGVSQKVKAELRKHLKYLHNYPDPDTKRLRKILAQHHGIDPGTILCGNGSAELVYLIARTLKPARVFIFSPAFPEYERACRICSSPQVTYWNPAEENIIAPDADRYITALEKDVSRPSEDGTMIFLCNPNYPAGTLLKADAVREIAETAKRLACYLTVDESFIDFCPGNSLIKYVADNPYLIVLRSMSPFYALSGLRIGYGVFHASLIENLREHREPWTVNSLAQRAAVSALKDKAYIADTMRTIKEEKGFLEKNFRKLGVKYFTSSANFYLLQIDNAEDIGLRLKRRGILVAGCSSFRGLDGSYMAVAVKSHRENALFFKELAMALDRSEFPCLSNDG